MHVKKRRSLPLQDTPSSPPTKGELYGQYGFLALQTAVACIFAMPSMQLIAASISYSSQLRAMILCNSFTNIPPRDGFSSLGNAAHGIWIRRLVTDALWADPTAQGW